MGTARICVGAIAGAFGVHGEVRLKSFCVPPEAIAGYGPLWLEDGSRSFEVALTRRVAGGLGARLSGVASKEAADGLRGVRLHADRAALPALPEDEFYHADLIGLQAQDPGGRPLGRIRAVLNHGAGDLLEVAPETGSATGGAAGGQAVLVPFTRAIVPTVDLAAGRVVVDPPEGLFG